MCIRDSYLYVQILEKRLFWWTLRHFESAYYPVMPVKVGDQVLLIGSYTGWNAGEAAKVRLRGENGEIRLPRKQERFLCRGASYLGYAFDMDPDFRGGWRIEYLDKEGDPLPDLSPRSVNDAAVRRVGATPSSSSSASASRFRLMSRRISANCPEPP